MAASHLLPKHPGSFLIIPSRVCRIKIAMAHLRVATQGTTRSESPLFHHAE